MTRRWLLLVSGIFLLALSLSFAAAGALAEAAIHPIFKRHPSDAASLAYLIAIRSRSTATKVSITTNDGVILNAWWLVPQQSNGRAVVVCHGVPDFTFGSLGYSLLFLTHGYSVLVPDSRGHGESGGFVTYGILESPTLFNGSIGSTVAAS